VFVCINCARLYGSLYVDAKSETIMLYYMWSVYCEM